VHEFQRPTRKRSLGERNGLSHTDQPGNTEEQQSNSCRVRPPEFDAVRTEKTERYPGVRAQTQEVEVQRRKRRPVVAASARGNYAQPIERTRYDDDDERNEVELKRGEESDDGWRGDSVRPKLQTGCIVVNVDGEGRCASPPTS
jgi:hypothetical protein